MTLHLSKLVRDLIQVGLDEDVGRGDVTTEATVPPHVMAHARLSSKQELVVAGMDVFQTVYAFLDGSLHITVQQQDGDLVAAGTLLAELEGRARSLLMGERVALNFLQRLSGIATLTRCYVEAVKGYTVAIIDTRKTTPGWR
ncbi:MAG: nicotinate-nucleotide diphosphorylase (carboxylating), partial [Nitrospinae bacterium]|nr:nicotinate-nucleotide diphosphorylase (carboxylating) [Nitrospinota bacterium]